MATLTTGYPTLQNLTNSMGPDGRIAKVAEVLRLTNEPLDTMPWLQANNGSSHRSHMRTGIPTSAFRRMYGRVQPTTGTVAPVDDTCGEILEYSVVDKKLADLGGDPAAYRWLLDQAHIQAISHKVMATIIDGNDTLNDAEFTGILARFNSLSADNAAHIIRSGSTPDRSIILQVWGPMTAFGFYPKGSSAGLYMNDEGAVTSETADGLMPVYRTMYGWDCGFAMPDWRGTVRIQYDESELTKARTSGPDLIDLMTQAVELIPTSVMNSGTPEFIMNRTAKSILRRQIANGTASSTLRDDNIAGKRVTMFDDIRVSRCDALARAETAVA